MKYYFQSFAHSEGGGFLIVHFTNFDIIPTLTLFGNLYKGESHSVHRVKVRQLLMNSLHSKRNRMSLFFRKNACFVQSVGSVN